MANQDFKETERKIQEYWTKNDVNKFDKKSKKHLFTVDVPPPTISGQMHLGHAMAYTQSDAVARFKKMKGFELFYPFGFDDNGLPSEKYVEKKRGIKAKKMNRNEFIKICSEEVLNAEQELTENFKKLGLGVDWNLLYTTINNDSKKIAQHSFIDLYEKKRVYRKESPSMYCVSCETTIAQAELKDVEKETFFNDVYFELEGGEKIVISTTRPELLPACVAVFVNPEDYKNKKLIGKKAVVPLFGQTVKIIGDKRVDKDKGTGIVMSCTFGDQTDMEWFQAYNLDLKIIIDSRGVMNENAGVLKGLKVEEARKKVLELLKEKKLLTEQKKIVHSVNVHERCDTPIEFIVSMQWFVKYLDLKEKFIKEAEKIKWTPPFMKARYDNWIKNLQWDWGISRQRYFGINFPVWYCRKCEKEIIASKKELPVDPLISFPKKKCECGSSEFEAEKDVLDTWFTSSLTPQINGLWTIDDEFFKKFMPMSLRPQGHDIITLWAFNTIVKSLLHHEKLPWKEIMINGFALDPKGKKMSKSTGNIIKPEEIIEKYSVDMLRYWALSSNLGEDLAFQEKELISGRKLLVKIQNASSFVDNLAGKESLDFEYEKLSYEDKWILSKLQKVIKECDDALEEYNFSKALKKTREFFWHDFCDYYIEEVKKRAYDGESNAKTVLKIVLLDCLKLFAPLLPHISEDIYLNVLNLHEKKKSIHWEDFPKPNKKLINEKAEEIGEKTNKIIAFIRKYKNEKGLSLNEELEKVSVFTEDEETKKMILNGERAVKDTCRIKKLEISIGKKGIEADKGINVLMEE